MFSPIKSGIRRAGYFFYRIRDLENRVAQLEDFVGKQAAAAAPDTRPASLSLNPGPLNGRWSPLGGTDGSHSWERTGAKRARALLVHKDRLWVGIDSGRKGPAALYALKDDLWTQVGGGGLGWSHGQEVHTLCAHAGLIYAGISSKEQGAQLWRTDDGSDWERVGHWPDQFSVSAICDYEGSIFVALVGGKMDVRAPILAHDGEKWRDVGDSGVWQRDYLCAYDMHVHGGEFYAGFIGQGWFGGHVWRLSNSPELIGGDGCRQSWQTNSTVLRLRSVGGKLVAIMNREPQAPGNFSNIRVFDGEQWSFLPALPAACAQLYSFNALCHYKGKLVIGAGGRPAGRAGVFYLDGVIWRRLGGHGVNESWSPPLYRDQFAPLSNNRAAEYVYQFCEYEGDLIAGFGASRGCAQVWRFSPTA